MTDDEPVDLALDRHQRGGRRDSGLGREHRRRRIVQAADAERAIDQLHRTVLARDLPVPLAHVADEHRVKLPVHRVHLAEVGIADHRLGGAHQRRRVRVALGREPVAVGHQVRGGEQRQLPEAAVVAERVEVEREPVVAAVLDHRRGSPPRAGPRTHGSHAGGCRRPSSRRRAAPSPPATASSEAASIRLDSSPRSSVKTSGPSRRSSAGGS